MPPTEIPTSTPTDLYDVASGKTATDGAIAALDASGDCQNAADQTAIKVAGIFRAVRAGKAEIKEGVFLLANSGDHPFGREDRGAIAFVEDKDTVGSDKGTHAVIAGLVVDVDADGVWVDTRAAARAAAQALHDVGPTSESDMVTPTTAALTLTAMTGTANTAPAAETNLTELTDNGGGAADGTVAAQAAPVTLTDSSGKDSTHDDTVAAITNLTELTDNGGGTADGTVAAQAAPVTLTDSSGKDGTHGDTLAAATAPTAPVITFSANDPTIVPDGAVTVADGSAPSVAELLEFCEELKKCVADTATAVGVLLQNDSNNGQKVIELVTLAGVAQNNLKEVTTELAKQRTANDVLAQNQSDLAQKVIQLVTLAGVAQSNLKEVTTELATQRALNTVLINNSKTFATQLNAAKVDIAAIITVLKAQDIMASA